MRSNRKSSSRAKKKSFSKESFLLPDDFVPSENDILCGRTKESLNHSGNKVFREIIFSHLDRYENAVTKLDKSIVVSSIVVTLRSKCPNNGGFIRRDETGRWEEIGDVLAREKVGHALRDAIKTRNRRAKKVQAEKRSPVQLKRESLLRMQRKLFEESLSQIGETVDTSLPSIEVVQSSQHEQGHASEETTPAARDLELTPTEVDDEFYGVDEVVAEWSQYPEISRQVTLEDTSQGLQKRKATDECYSSIPSAQPQPEHVPTSEEPFDPPGIPHFLTLEMMPDPAPVFGPGRRQTSYDKMPKNKHRRMVSLDQPLPSLDRPAEDEFLFGLSDDNIDGFVVHRISNTAA